MPAQMLPTRSIRLGKALPILLLAVCCALCACAGRRASSAPPPAEPEREHSQGAPLQSPPAVAERPIGEAGQPQARTGSQRVPQAPVAPARVEPGYITIQPGETLSYISALYAVSEKDLIAWNGLNSAQDIRAGQRLTIRPPVTSGAPSARTGRAAEPAHQTAAPARDETASDGTMTVVAGQTLSGIAAQYKVSAADLRRWNKLKSDQLQIGQKLRVAAPVRVHTIKAGENLSGIAARYKVSVKDLMQKNKLAKADVLPVGKELIIP